MGKSTSLACMIDHRNANSEGHIITIEDPIEYRHENQRAVIEQIEVEIDIPKRDAMIAKVWKRMKDDIIYLPLHHQVIVWAMRDKIDLPIVAEDLGVKPETVLEMESRLSGSDIGYDLTAADDDEDSNHFAPAAYLTDESNDPALTIEQDDWESESSNNLSSAMEQLDDRSRTILQERWLTEKKSTLHELAARYDVSAERIRQLEKNAIGKLKKSLSA